MVRIHTRFSAVLNYDGVDPRCHRYEHLLLLVGYGLLNGDVRLALISTQSKPKQTATSAKCTVLMCSTKSADQCGALRSLAWSMKHLSSEMTQSQSPDFKRRIFEGRKREIYRDFREESRLLLFGSQGRMSSENALGTSEHSLSGSGGQAVPKQIEVPATFKLPKFCGRYSDSGSADVSNSQTYK